MTDAQIDALILSFLGGGTKDDLRAMLRAAVAAEREAILQALPGGSWCDPQQIADMIRARGTDA
jgi:hypothetical protein